MRARRNSLSSCHEWTIKKGRLLIFRKLSEWKAEGKKKKKKKNLYCPGVPGWFSRLSIQLSISAQDLVVQGFEHHIRLCTDGTEAA